MGRRFSPLATISGHRRFTSCGREMLRQKAADANRNTRLREIHVLHQDDADPLHRMLNALQPGTYARPHRHLDPPKSEGFVILQGTAGIVLFEEHGEEISEEYILLDQARGELIADVRPGVWHTLLALAPDTVLYEVKPGPYSAVTDKDFAPWTPGADSDAAGEYLGDLERRFRDALGLD
ncbi:WbuC family cupin fold metalloprotein [Desulfonatronum thioautotrophicum]|uniref:WbuC family cupin fold metalloprotein n=1 Tax=Desulfonatronum thioautotrophicum TaxID=617001 RepID=UPI001FCA34A3|nr:WbuC family cupin fold metalloprotein [Desulfonatronum thioautotrophicum]